jgi:phosphoenolpyruvate carboxykinase (GTP)
MNLLTGELKSFVEEIVKIAQPDSVHVVEGTEEEFQNIIDLLKEKKTLHFLDPEKRPGSYLAWSNPEDVARVEDKTFICSAKEEDAGPTNNWKDPILMKEQIRKLFTGCMKGRTLYVVPYCMGPIDSPYARFGVELTDSPYVVANLRIMTRVNKLVLRKMDTVPFVRTVHSVGVPLASGQKDVPWPCNTKDLVIAHFPETQEVYSFGSGYGGNALLSKKCFALRIASCMARQEGWFAEHMLIIGVTTPENKKYYVTGSFPSACGKTNLAMLQSSLPGWKIECVGDDIAWMFWDEKGQLRAINPEFGFFGVAPGTSLKTNRSAIETVKKNTLFTNVGKTADDDVWWEGLTDTPPRGLTTWRGVPYDAASGQPAAHPNARFTAPVTQCPTLDPAWNNPEGVPISAIIFGGRRASLVPLVREAESWKQGVFFGASMTSETTAAAKGVVGQVRHDPFAMLPFCGYNMADYFSHWLSMEKPGRILPKIFYVNWFLKDNKGSFVWPGFSENTRVLEWMLRRVEKKVGAKKTPLGLVPEEKDISLPKGCSYAALFPFDKQAWRKEEEDLSAYFSKFKEKMPKILTQELEKIKKECM